MTFFHRTSTAPTVSSAYSSEYGGVPDDDSHAVPALGAKDSYHPSFHANPRQQIHDNGPVVRQSRIPVFHQVRNLLQTRAPPLTTSGSPKWDEYTGELSEEGKPSRVQPSNYVSPFDAAFKSDRKQSPPRPSKPLNNSSRSPSPVSVLTDPLITAQHLNPDGSDWSPVSPVNRLSVDQSLVPEPLSPNVVRTTPPRPPQPQPRTPIRKPIRRKPVLRSVSTTESATPESGKSSRLNDISDRETVEEESGQKQPNSHFSWTTYAPSVAPTRPSVDTGRPSIDTMSPRQNRDTHGEHQFPKSRFSWSTVNTTTTNQTRPVTPPSHPPPIPAKFSSPPMQSILSRRRPIQRQGRDEWTPPPRKLSIPFETSPSSTTPSPSAITAKNPLPFHSDSTKNDSKPQHLRPAGKALPPPPTLSPATKRTRLETLLTQQKDLALQRRNVEKAIAELELVEVASPINVSWAAVRDARATLARNRTRLNEILLEERDVGVAISRARRKEGAEEALWVRRVTA